MSVTALVAGVTCGVLISPATVGIILAIAGLALAVLTDKEGSSSPVNSRPRRSITTVGSAEPIIRSPERSP